MANPEIVEYIRRNRPRYIDAAIQANLVRNGFRPEEIDEAFAALPAAPTSTGWRTTLGQGSFWGVYLSVIAGSILILWIIAASASDGLPLIMLAMVVLLIVGARSESFEQSIRRGIGAAVVTMILLPVVVVGGIWAYCLVAQPQVF